MATQEEVIELAKARSAAMQQYAFLQACNTPTDYVERVALDARYKLTEAAFFKADRAYQDAINSLTADQLSAAANAVTSKQSD